MQVLNNDLIPYEPVQALVKTAKRALKNEGINPDQKYEAVGNVFKGLSCFFKENKMIFPNGPSNQLINSSFPSDINKSAIEKMEDAGRELHVILGDVKTNYPYDKAFLKAQNLMERISYFVVLKKVQKIIVDAKINIVLFSGEKRLQVLPKAFDQLSETLEPLVSVRHRNIDPVKDAEESSLLECVSQKASKTKDRVSHIKAFDFSAELAIDDFIKYALQESQKLQVAHRKYKTEGVVAKKDSSLCDNFIKVVVVVGLLAIFAKQIL